MKAEGLFFTLIAELTKKITQTTKKWWQKPLHYIFMLIYNIVSVCIKSTEIEEKVSYSEIAF